MVHICLGTVRVPLFPWLLELNSGLLALTWVWVGKQKLCWKWNQVLLPLSKAHKSSKLMVPQNSSDWLQWGLGMHKECEVKPHVLLTSLRRCVIAASTKTASQCPSDIISVYVYTVLTATIDPLLCFMSMQVAKGGAVLLRGPRRMWNPAPALGFWGQWIPNIRVEIAPTQDQLHPFSSWSEVRDTTWKWEDETWSTES